MRAHEFYTRRNETHVTDGKFTLRALNKLKHIRRARAVDEQRRLERVRMVYGNGRTNDEKRDFEIERAELELERQKAELEELKAQIGLMIKGAEIDAEKQASVTALAKKQIDKAMNDG